MFRLSRPFMDAAHEAAAKRQFDILASRKGVYKKGVYLKFLGGSMCALGVYFPISFWLADRMEEDGNTFGNPTSIHLLEAMPLHWFSRSLGAVATSTAIPAWVHQSLIRFGISFNKVDLEEYDQDEIASWRVLQDFFERKIRLEARPIEAGALVCSPCDGQLLKCGLVDSDNKMVQVKGCSYTVQNLFRSTVEVPPALKDSTQRYYFAFRLSPHNYHRFHAPVTLKPIESVHVPGYLYPVMRAATRYIPMLYVNNERVILNGDIVSDAKSAKSSSVLGKISMAFVGATCVGGIHLNMDTRIKTNLDEPPPYALHRKYDRALSPVIKRGEEVGYFSIGSAIVMVVDVPKDRAIVVTEGHEVKMGQTLIR